MNYSQQVRDIIRPYYLLDHPFYQDWSEGKLSLETLQDYAKQYYHHVEAFPRYISTTHSQCSDIKKRKVLLENLMDEEGVHGVDHPELWMRFAESVGNTREEVLKSQKKEGVKQIIETFFSMSRSSYEEGLTAFYAYEYQVPEIAETKMKGLKEHYGITGKEALSFFSVHKAADVYHRQACEKLMDQLPEESQQKGLIAAEKAARSLWSFLTSMQKPQLSLS